MNAFDYSFFLALGIRRNLHSSTKVRAGSRAILKMQPCNDFTDKYSTLLSSALAPKINCIDSSSNKGDEFEYYRAYVGGVFKPAPVRHALSNSRLAGYTKEATASKRRYMNTCVTVVQTSCFISNRGGGFWAGRC
jgi:hypothetical protein